jgi:murein DD-endopeptidase MepM/ murein hydrolase activator NlpD
VKQQLISTGLAVADLIQTHPKRITAMIAAVMLGSGAYAVASLAPAAPTDPLRLVSEPVEPVAAVAPQAELLDAHTFTLYRSEQTRVADTPEALLSRLGLADPIAAAFLRQNATVRQALFNHPGRVVTAEANDRLELQTLRTRWIDADAGAHGFKRLVVERSDKGGFSIRTETAPLTSSQRVASGVIRSTLYGATDDAQLPDSVTKQLTQIFESSIDFHRGLHRGDRFSVVYETLEADGEPVLAGKILSAEFVNRGTTRQAFWFREEDSAKGDYYSADGQSLRRAYLASPLAVSRLTITSRFGMRTHPILGYSRAHTGVDYGAPTGTPVRTIGDGTVQFAGVQSGYGKVVFIRHRNRHDTTVYGHLSRIDVMAGDKVEQGDTIGLVGATGMATGPHLHFEYRVDSQPRNPVEMLAEQRGAEPMSSANKVAFARVAASMKSQLATANESMLSTRDSFE